MTHDDAFLRAIIERPDDDAPRLIYADYLDERDDPTRAEFIRLQCELAPLPEEAPRRVALEARERDLLTLYHKPWAGPLVGLAHDWWFRRGFVEGITIGGNGFVTYAGFLFQLAPLREIKLTRCYVRQLALVPQLSRLTRLVLRGVNFGDGEAALVVASPHLSQGITVELTGNRLTERGKQLLQSKFGDRVHVEPSNSAS